MATSSSLLLHVDLRTPPACVKHLLAHALTHPPTTPTKPSPWWMGLAGQGRDWADRSCPQISGQRQLEVKAFRRALHFFFRKSCCIHLNDKRDEGESPYVCDCVYICVYASSTHYTTRQGPPQKTALVAKLLSCVEGIRGSKRNKSI